MTAHEGSKNTLERLKTVQPCSNFCATVQPFALPLCRRQAAAGGGFFSGKNKLVETSGVDSAACLFREKPAMIDDPFICYLCWGGIDPCPEVK